MHKIALAALMTLPLIRAAEPAAPAFHVDITGKGKPMILIPGFASSGKTWDATVAHYKDRYECHVLTLAGFAGQPPTEKTPFLESVRNDLAAYIREKKLDHPVVVGHSLGGFVAMWLAAENPDLTGPIVIVDSLPFLSAIMNPSATSESAKPMAETMRKSYSAEMTSKEMDETAERSVRPMVTSEANYEMIRAWGRKSDRATMGNAMYDMFTTDLRADLAKIKSPVLVLGTWVAYKQYASREQIEANFRRQYTALKKYDFQLFDSARHFIMLDDPEGFYQAVDRFLNAGGK